MVFGIRIMSVNNVQGKWHLLVEWKDPSGEYYIILHEGMRFLANIVFPEEIVEQFKPKKKEESKSELQIVLGGIV